jgi:fructosamine-3-kinase
MAADSAVWNDIAARIGQATRRPFAPRATQALGGGCINQAARLIGDGGDYFVKFNDVSRSDMFAAEAEGLTELAAAQALRVPAVVCHGTVRDSSFLVLEFLELSGGDGHTPERLGHGLARLHRATSPMGARRGPQDRDVLFAASDTFGWKRDNTIGSTPQINTPSRDWIDFWRERRLGYQLALAARHGLRGEIQRRGEQLLAGLEGFFTDYRPVPSLLHGDLWGGNQAALPDGTPVIFDPAVYFGDREADLAMTELFGGFSRTFYCAYHEAWPLDAGYPIRKTLYNLYHVLNHFNLFGGGYGAQAGRMIDSLLSELD